MDNKKIRDVLKSDAANPLNNDKKQESGNRISPRNTKTMPRSPSAALAALTESPHGPSPLSTAPAVTPSGSGSFLDRSSGNSKDRMNTFVKTRIDTAVSAWAGPPSSATAAVSERKEEKYIKKKKRWIAFLTVFFSLLCFFLIMIRWNERAEVPFRESRTRVHLRQIQRTHLL
jgi:hypothetical protein